MAKKNFCPAGQKSSASHPKGGARKADFIAFHYWVFIKSFSVGCQYFLGKNPCFRLPKALILKTGDGDPPGEIPEPRKANDS
jgi:hypothetical protein